MDKAYLTDWTDVADANKLIAEMIEKGLYKKNQIKKSSNKFKNGKDKKDGYVTRVEVIPGVHPELEVEIKYRGKKTKAVNAAAAKKDGNDSFSGGLKIDGKTYRTIDAIMDLEKNEYNFFCTDGDKFFIAKKKNIIGAPTVITDGPMTEDANHRAWAQANAKNETFQNGGRVMQPVKKAAQGKPQGKNDAAAKADKPAKKAAAKAPKKAAAKAKPKAKVVVKPKAKAAKKK